MSLTVSTSSISTASAALQILKRPSPLDAINSDPSMSPMDRLTAIVNAVSSEDSPAKTDAASKITSSLLDQQESADSLVARAMKLLESNSVVMSDPSLKDVLKSVVTGNPGEFAAFFRKELSSKQGITDDNAMINALSSMIGKHRDCFGDGEFVFGAKLGNGGVILTSIKDKNGKSADSELASKIDDLQTKMADLAESQDPERSPADYRKQMSEIGAAFQAAVRERYDYWAKWADKLGARTF